MILTDFPLIQKLNEGSQLTIAIPGVILSEESLWRLLPDELFEEIKMAIIRAGQVGMSEYTLIKSLDKERFHVLNQLDFSTPQRIFPFHFLLFHRLYRWQSQLAEGGDACLEVSPLCIRYDVITSRSKQLPSDYDPMPEYYMDLFNFFETEGVVLENMISRFWKRFLARDEIVEAMAALQLEKLTDAQQVKRQYKRLISLHHPDRGGEEHNAQRINSAKEILLSFLKSK